MADSSQALASWLLDRIEASEEALATLRAERAAGHVSAEAARDQALPHWGLVEKLYDAGGRSSVEVPAELAGVMEAIQNRDLYSGPEEVLEKALAAYIERHAERDAGLPKDWQTTIAAARDEVAGKTQGVFGPDFTSRLADAARHRRTTEATREAGKSKGRER